MSKGKKLANYSEFNLINVKYLRWLPLENLSQQITKTYSHLDSTTFAFGDLLLIPVVIIPLG